MAKEYAGTHGVTDSNMMIFLGIIEDRVNQILQAYSLITAQVKISRVFCFLLNKMFKTIRWYFLFLNLLLVCGFWMKS